MKEFADKSAPGLFNVILQFILQEDPRLSEEHRVLEENRTVVLLHIIAYCFFFNWMYLKYRSPWKTVSSLSLISLFIIINYCMFLNQNSRQSFTPIWISVLLHNKVRFLDVLPFSTFNSLKGKDILQRCYQLWKTFRFQHKPKGYGWSKKQAPQGADFKYTSSKFSVVYNLKATV